MNLILWVLTLINLVLVATMAGAFYGWIGMVSDKIDALDLHLMERSDALIDDVRDLMNVMTEEDRDAP